MGYQVLTPEMIKPVDAKISTALAKQAFRIYAIKTGVLHREEVAEHAAYMVDEIREELAFRKSELARAKDEFGTEVRELRREVETLRRRAAKAKTLDEKADLDAEAQAAEAELAQSFKFIAEAQELYDALKDDKRQFLVDYINRHFGPSPQDRRG